MTRDRNSTLHAYDMAILDAERLHEQALQRMQMKASPELRAAYETFCSDLAWTVAAIKTRRRSFIRSAIAA